MSSFSCDLSFVETLWFFLKNFLAIFLILTVGYSLFFGWVFVDGRYRKWKRNKRKKT